MGSYGVPQLNPPVDPSDSLTKMLKLRQLVQGNDPAQQILQNQAQAGQLTNQKQQMENQAMQRRQKDMQTAMQVLQQAGPNKTWGDVLPTLRGKIGPDTYMEIAKVDREHTADVKSKFDIMQSQHGEYQKIYDAIQAMPDEQYMQAWPQIADAISKVPENQIPVDPKQPIPKAQLASFAGPLLSLNQGYLDKEEARKKEKAGVAKTEAETAKLSMEAKQGGSSVDMIEMNDWLKKNPDKSPADFMRYKATLVPQFNFNLQANGLGATKLNPRQEATAQAILDGRMSPPGSFALKTPYWQAVMGAVFEKDPNWNEQRAQLRKGYTVGSQSKEINAINAAMGHVGVLGDAIDALNNKDVRVLNAIANRLGVETGKDPVTTFKTIVHRVGPEITKAYIGAGGSAGERGSDEKDFDPNLGPQQLRSNVSMTAKLLRSKISSLENQWNQNAPEGQDFQSRFIMPEAKAQLDKWAPQGGGQQAAPIGVTNLHVNPQTGEKIGWDGKQWVKVP